MSQKPSKPKAPDAGAPKALTSKITNASVHEHTARTWDDWFALLDDWGAMGREHGDIVRWLTDEQGIDHWWAQTLTVGYEQERGMRAPGQNASGYFSASVSKTVDASAERLFEAFTDPKLRKRWLPDQIKIRTAAEPKSLRADWEDGSTRIAVGFTPKGHNRAQVALLHEKLPDAETAAELKALWRDRLAALKDFLEA
ncbi:SRPBCC family protein [Actinomadura rudentiformis]|uniref:DUF4287 domain-containing protein n=1 Tax=Actinomadura rudentiformis TaxID=359158 RepID=A0A6H9YNK9_9ACTN|nr:hypothetical protein [Actinomadura rudentiformis]KAB2346407.1 hypothetical protein F8566_23330 [Actinomadura rudentiformis]